jgi:uncharacterized membrane protein YfcA
MSLFAIMMVSIGAFAGGLVNGLAGFGTGLFALGWWLAAMPVNDAVSLVIIMSIFSGVQGLFIVRFSLNAPDLGLFLVPALLGIGVGFAVLDWVNVLFLKMIVATLLVLFGLYFTIWRHIPKLRRRHLLGDISTGFAGGALGAVAGLSGALPTMWCALHDWPKSRQRAVIQPFNLLIHIIVAALMIWQNRMSANILWLALLAIPTSIIGTQVGLLAFRKLPEPIFHQTLIWLILLSGIALVLREMAAIVFQA